MMFFGKQTQWSIQTYLAKKNFVLSICCAYVKMCTSAIEIFEKKTTFSYSARYTNKAIKCKWTIKIREPLQFKNSKQFNDKWITNNIYFKDSNRLHASSAFGMLRVIFIIKLILKAIIRGFTAYNRRNCLVSTCCDKWETFTFNVQFLSYFVILKNFNSFA